jgi:hypothetical protein
MASQVKPYASSKDWEKIESDIKQELEADKPEGEVSCLKSSFLSFPPHSLTHSTTSSYHLVLDVITGGASNTVPRHLLQGG